VRAGVHAVSWLLLWLLCWQPAACPAALLLLSAGVCLRLLLWTWMLLLLLWSCCCGAANVCWSQLHTVSGPFISVALRCVRVPGGGAKE
jgi:hypothetical protein